MADGKPPITKNSNTRGQYGRVNYNSQADVDWLLQSTITNLSTLNWCMSVLGITAPESLIHFSLEQCWYCMAYVLCWPDLEVTWKWENTWTMIRTCPLRYMPLLWTLQREIKGHYASFHHKGGKTVDMLPDKYSSIFTGHRSIVRTTL